MIDVAEFARGDRRRCEAAAEMVGVDVDSWMRIVVREAANASAPFVRARAVRNEDSEIDEMAELLALGWSKTEIAKRMGMRREKVSTRLARGKSEENK